MAERSGEFSIIDRFFSSGSAAGPWFCKGIGDDCAIIDFGDMFESLRGHHVESLAFLSGKAFLFHGAVPDRNRILFGPQYNEIRPPRKKGRNMGLFRFDQGCGRRMCSLAKGTDAA